MRVSRTLLRLAGVGGVDTGSNSAVALHYARRCAVRGARFACTHTLRTSRSRPTRSLVRIAISRQRHALDRPTFFAKRA